MLATGNLLGKLKNGSLSNKMAEFKLYPTYQQFHDRILARRERDYFLTTRIPTGVTIQVGEVPLPERSFFERFISYKESRPVICVGYCDNGKNIFAVNKKKLEELGGKLGEW